MKKILILEDRIREKISSYDHVFSFCSNPADSFTQDYVTETEIEALYDQEFESMVQYLRLFEGKENFSYRGVNLLWCYKKTLIEFAFYIRQRYEILERVMAKYPAGKFFLERRNEILQYPSLAKVSQSSPLGERANLHFFQKQKDKFEKKMGEPRHNPFPNIIKIGDLVTSKICIFSDYEKSKSVLKKVSSYGSVLFSNSKSPRTILRAIQNKVALYQAAYNPTPKEEKLYRKKSEAFVNCLRENPLFSDYLIGKLKGGELLTDEINRLFDSSLSPLLFEIDHMHRFFSETKFLQSVLLDEDVSATKNAFCQVARQYKVWSAVECHGALARKNGILPLTADTVFVWGRAQKHKLVEWGCSEEQIIVSGCSRYNQYRKLDTHQVRNKIAGQFGFDPEKKIALLAFPSSTVNRGCWFWEDKINKNISKTLEAVVDLLGKLDSLQLLIKVHPGDEKLRFYNKWVAKQRKIYKYRVNMAYKFDPLMLAKASDFLIVYMSTYAVEGFALDKPVIYLFSEEDRLLNEIRKFDALLYPQNNEELKKMVGQLIHNGEVKPGFWRQAKKEYLNENGTEPEEIITSYLIGSKKQTVYPHYQNN